jgi:hypothetical protein
MRRYLIAKAESAKAKLERHSTRAPDGEFAFQRALLIETVALGEYKDVLTTFVDLTVDAKVPK